MNHLTELADQPLHRALGLTDWEARRIQELLGRDPNHFELAVFSLLWSEHCGYKHSAPLLKRLPSAGERVLQGPGENAGVLDLGDGTAVAFKVESHNHPSAVEPFQGAATGIGGILRDIIAMGARPVALLDGLWFGEPDFHFWQAVSGIGHYGNCLAADEHVCFRNSGRVRTAKIGELAEQRANLEGDAWTASPQKPFEILSVDPETHMPEWRSVTRIFKRNAAVLLRISTRLGRTLTVTPDHPVMVWDDGGLVERTARKVRPGDRLPILAALPESENAGHLDLIEAAPSDAVVTLPREWTPTTELRVALRKIVPRADSRHYWLSRCELPIDAFRQVEALTNVRRDALRLRLPGPRSTSVPATIALDARFARLIGYYLAEGCCSANGTTSKIIWTFAIDGSDDRWIDDLRDILTRLGLRHSTERRSSTIAITVSSRLLADLFVGRLECGHRSHEKSIPPELFADRLLRAECVKAILRGDGSLQFRKSGSRVKISHVTTSRALHEQLLLAFQSLGAVPSRFERVGGTGVIAGRQVQRRPAFGLEVTGHEAVRRSLAFYDAEERLAIAAALDPTEGSPFARPRAVDENTIATVEVIAVEKVEDLLPSMTSKCRALTCLPRAAASSHTTASACRTSAGRPSSIPRTPATASSTRCASGCSRPSGCARRRRASPAASSSSTARRPGATASAARPCSRAPS